MRFNPYLFLWAALPLVGVLLVGAIVLWVVQRWSRKHQSPDEQGDQGMTTFRDLYERGELTKEEYDRIRGKLQTRMRKELDLPAPPRSEAPEPPADQQVPPQPGPNP